MKIYEDLLNKHLNMDKILGLPDYDKKIVLDLYKDLHDSLNGESGTPGNYTLPGGVKMDVIKAQVIYNTLVEYGFLVTRREENIDKILG